MVNMYLSLKIAAIGTTHSLKVLCRILHVCDKLCLPGKEAMAVIRYIKVGSLQTELEANVQWLASRL